MLLRCPHLGLAAYPLQKMIEVTAIAKKLIIMDLERMPPKSLMAQDLQEYKRDDISTEQMKSLLVWLTAESLEVDCRIT